MAQAPTDLTVRAESVQRIYEFYVNRRFRVNRRYQRKLVWTLEEKQTFIDSLRRGLPVPLILVAEEAVDGMTIYEVIDGMQRLNAIVSFIENEYSLDGEFFDLEALAETKLQLDAGTLLQKAAPLDRRISANIANYTVPLSVYKASSNEEVDEVFRRINSGGRHLSSHELRQVGAISNLSELVRQISSRIRGDVSSSDVLSLNDMAAISITSRELPYGISVDDVFWVKQGILTREQVRESRDEEVVAELLVAMLITPIPSSGRRYMDEFYGLSASEAKRQAQIEGAIARVGPEMIERQFMAVFEEIRNVLNETPKPFAKLVLDSPPPRVPRYFEILFLAMYELLVTREKRVKDHAALAKAIDGIGNRVVNVGSGGGNWGSGQKAENVDAVVGVIEKCFRDAKPGENIVLGSWVTEFENILTQSLTEHSLHDFKQGFWTLGQPQQFDANAFEAVLQTLSAMANHGLNATGYVIVGVADKEADSNRVEKIHGIKAARFRNFFITGIAHEAGLGRKTLDDYITWLLDKVRNSKLDPRLVDDICKDARLVRYYDKAVLVLRVKSRDEPIPYDDKFFIRSGTSTYEARGAQLNTVFGRFRTLLEICRAKITGS